MKNRNLELIYGRKNILSIGIIIFYKIEIKAKEPIVSFDIFTKTSTSVNLVLIYVFIMGLGFGESFTILTIIIQESVGYNKRVNMFCL